MHFSGVCIVMLPSPLCIAWVGQPAAQGAFAHWLQRAGMKSNLTLGNLPTVSLIIQAHWAPDCTLFSLLHAMKQPPHPVHL